MRTKDFVADLLIRTLQVMTKLERLLSYAVKF